MPNIKFQGWRFCRSVMKCPHPDESFAIYSKVHQEIIEKDDLLKKWNSEIVGGTNTSRMNPDSMKMNFKLKLIEEFGIHIDQKDARKFYHYLEQAEFIKIHLNLDEHTYDITLDGMFEFGTIDKDRYDAHITIALTNKGIDFANSSILAIFPIESTWCLSLLALAVSICAISK